MTTEKKPRFSLGTVDDLFTTQEIRNEEGVAKIRDLDVKKIDQFPKHPYKVEMDADLINLMESIKEYGVITPITVREKKDGRYEMISGHRRLKACKELGLKTIRSEVVDWDKDKATIAMVDSNLHRSKILPSEKAFAYKMRLDAMNRQGKRVDLMLTPMDNDSESKSTCAPLEHKLKSRDILAKEVGESKEQVRRYIRLTYLNPDILKMVDREEIALRPAVEISYLPPKLQIELLDCMYMEACTPSHEQTIRMRKLEKNGLLTKDEIIKIMREEKPNQRTRIALDDKKAKRYIPSDLPVSKREDFILEALKYYDKHLKRKKAREEKSER